MKPPSPDPIRSQRGAVPGPVPDGGLGGFIGATHLEHAMPAGPCGPPVGIRHPVRQAG